MEFDTRILANLPALNFLSSPCAPRFLLTASFHYENSFRQFAGNFPVFGAQWN